MKKNLLLFVVYCFLFSSALAQTNVSGFISANTTWNLAGSPYIVVGNALVSHGYTLTIEPGVVVKFNTDKALQIDGELVAIGNAQNRITFTSNQASPAAGDWAKIHFADTCVDAVFDGSGNYLSGCIMKYCDVFYGGGLGFGEIHIANSSPYFTHCKIAFSEQDGIYCQGSYYKLDSSMIINCSGIGLNNSLAGCGLKLDNDSIMNNLMGGIYGNACSGIITKNYFFGNLNRGAFFSDNSNDLKMTENYFLNNSSISQGGTIYAQGSNVTISKNYFDNNASTVQDKGIINLLGSNDTIECNRFTNNQTGQNGRGVLNAMLYGNSIIRKNLFDGNFSSNPYSVTVSYIEGGTSSNISFTDNTIRNNSSTSGKCCQFVQNILNGPPLIIVEGNNFVNNTTESIIHFTIPSSATINPYRFKLNNLSDPNSHYEFYNNFPYGSLNFYIDSNYWGSTSTQHIDSVIYDYFDDATKSVAYYSAFLTTPIDADTSCVPVLPTLINKIEALNFTAKLFPNPFSQQAVIRLEKELHGATFNLYNIYGQLVESKNNLSGKEIILNRENLGSGIYIYEVTDNKKRIFTGKAVIY